MLRKPPIWKILLLGPLSFLYGIIIFFRNLFYDNNLFGSKHYNIPTISIGNISVGGTGKTPHTEYLVDMLQKEFVVAVLSRGYKRKTKGFKIVEEDCCAIDCGDEPYQIKRKHPKAIVAVDGNRQRGIENLLKLYPELNVIILDDAFQHRKVKPGLSILLNNFSYPISKDYMLPLGRLRESKTSSIRAHIIIVTKCPKDLKPIERRIMHKEMDVLPFQHLFFSTINYNPLIPAFPEDIETRKISFEKLKEYNVLSFTGIAHTKNFINFLEPKCKSFKHIKFSDHRNFSKDDIKMIQSGFMALDDKKIIITTEKDYVRFLKNDLMPLELRKYFYYLPISVEFIVSDDEKKQFENQIFSYVRNNKRYSKLYKNSNLG